MIAVCLGVKPREDEQESLAADRVWIADDQLFPLRYTRQIFDQRRGSIPEEDHKLPRPVQAKSRELVRQRVTRSPLSQGDP